MKLIVGGLAGLISGWLGHQTNDIIDSWTNTPLPFRRLTRYGIGVVLVTLVMSIIKHGFKFNAWEDDVKDIVLASTFVGGGVFLGYVLDKK